MSSKIDVNAAIAQTHSTVVAAPYKGKVRDVYTLNDQALGIVVTDRISAFDHILPQPIPYKGQILNTIAAQNFEWVKDIVPTHIIDVPHPNVTVGKKCEPIAIEVVVRGYLTGHAWRTYKSGLRELCGVSLPEGLKEHQKLEHPIITPATKATEGHDEDISVKEILSRNIVSKDLWDQIESVALALFKRGTDKAAEKGLILVDTKYEFGLYNGELTLIDEVHTPDSSRYFYADSYQSLFEKGEAQKQLSKEFVREWLMEHGFQGLDGQKMPELSEDFATTIYERYAELYEKLMGKEFKPTDTKGFNDTLDTIFKKFI